jgi:hypothetical protein
MRLLLLAVPPSLEINELFDMASNWHSTSILATHSLAWKLSEPEAANYVQKKDTLSSSSPARLPTWLSTSAMKCMALAAINHDFKGSTTQRMPTPALMSPEGRKGRSDPALPLQREAQAPTALLVHSTTAERSLRLDQMTQYLPTAGKTDPMIYMPAPSFFHRNQHAPSCRISDQEWTHP